MERPKEYYDHWLVYGCVQSRIELFVFYWPCHHWSVCRTTSPCRTSSLSSAWTSCRRRTSLSCRAPVRCNDSSVNPSRWPRCSRARRASWCRSRTPSRASRWSWPVSQLSSWEYRLQCNRHVFFVRKGWVQLRKIISITIAVQRRLQSEITKHVLQITGSVILKSNMAGVDILNGFYRSLSF